MKSFYSNCLIIILLSIILNDVAWARGGHHGHRHHHHGHLNFGINIGGYNSGFYGPGFYQFRSYGYPVNSMFMMPRARYVPRPVVSVIPPVYVQREQPSVQPQANYWHYCQSPAGYYPNIESCPGGWIQVAPQSTME